jgi:Tfp pilus assembly protein PilN
MMLDNNLSTRPFYNERLVLLWIAAAALVIGVATVLNVSHVVYYSRSDTELKSQAARDETRAAELVSAATKLRASVDAAQVDAASAEARLANDLINRRTFSWTLLMNQLEATIPPDVRITSVRPSVDTDHRVVLNIALVARGVDDVNEFLESLEMTGAFSGLLSREEQINEEGQLVARMETTYVPPTQAGSPAGAVPTSTEEKPR